MTLDQARILVESEFPGLEWLCFHESPRRYEWDIKEFLRLQGAVFLHWKTGDDFRMQLARERLTQGGCPEQPHA